MIQKISRIFAKMSETQAEGLPPFPWLLRCYHDKIY